MDIARIGLTVCYDLRFPEFYAALCRNNDFNTDDMRSSGSSPTMTEGGEGKGAGGAEVVLVPAAFTVRTGEAHWQILLRARAIENQCYIIAAAQSGLRDINILTY